MSPTSYHCSTPRYSIISPNRASSTAEKLYLASAEVHVRKREKFRCPKVGTHWERDRGRDCARSLGSGSEKAGHAGDDYIEEGSSHGEWPADDTGNDAEVQRNRS